MDGTHPNEASDKSIRCATCDTGIAPTIGACCFKCWESEQLKYGATHHRDHAPSNGRPVAHQPADDSPQDTGTQGRRVTQEDTEAQERRHSSPPGDESSESSVSPSESHVPEYLREVFKTAKQKPLPPVTGRYYLLKMKLLVAICAELQVAAGEATFFLTCRHAGDLIREDFRRVNNWLKKLEVDNVLLRVSTGSKASRKANEYRFQGGQP